MNKLLKKVVLATASFVGLMGVGTLAANASTYTVKSGDSLWEIANDNGVSINSILTDNPSKLSSINSVIYPDEQLELNQVATQVSTNNSSYNAPQATYKPSTNNYTSANEQAGTASNTGNNSYASSNDTNSNSANVSSGNSAHSSAANSIAQAESGGSYTAENSQYYGKFQLDKSYLHGDYSPANQDRVFVKYCNQRYGSVNNALSFRESHGWY